MIPNKTRFLRTATLALLAATGISISMVAAADGTTQTLDRVFAYVPGAAINLAVGNASRPPDFTPLLLSGTAISTCTLTVASGIYCLDGQTVRQWPNPMTADNTTLFSCGAALGLDPRKDSCTSMTVDDKGAIWLGVKRQNSHSVFKVVITNGVLTSSQFYFGRPPLVDLAAISGPAADDFRPLPNSQSQAGVLGVEERKAAVFYPDPQATAPITVVSAKDWGLKGNELLQDIALLQMPRDSGGKLNFILATTSNGRVMAKNIEMAGLAFEVYNIPAARGVATPNAAKCSSTTQQYGLRVSQTSGEIYISDLSYCQVLSLTPQLTSNGQGLVNPLQRDQLLSTVDTNPSQTAYPALGLTLAPGISIDLRAACAVSCAVINSSTGDPAVQLSSVQLGAGTSGVTVFQVKNIPDCRYASQLEASSLQLCISKANATDRVLIDPAGNPVSIGPGGALGTTLPPAALYLNVRPLMPKDATRSFNLSSEDPAQNGLPKLLISPQYRAQQQNGYVFQAMFVVTQPGIRFTGFFEARYYLDRLTGAASRCVPNPSNLLTWDVGTFVSEKYLSVDNKYVDTLANYGPCGSFGTGLSRMSLLPYNMEIAPDTYGPTVLQTAPKATAGNDAVFGRLMQKLYGDLNTVRINFGCAQADQPSGTSPLGGACGTLGTIWTAGKGKLDSCMAEAFQPHWIYANRDGDHDRDDYIENVRADCPAFRASLVNFQNALGAIVMSSDDIANRLGELTVRVKVMVQLYDERFWPSIPYATGFCTERGGCPPPTVPQVHEEDD